MNIFKYISFLLIVIISLLSSCAKMDSPKEVKSNDFAEETVLGTSKMMTPSDENTSEDGITDPDNDEDHDRDAVSNKN